MSKRGQVQTVKFGGYLQSSANTAKTIDEVIMDDEVLMVNSTWMDHNNKPVLMEMACEWGKTQNSVCYLLVTTAKFQFDFLILSIFTLIRLDDITVL